MSKRCIVWGAGGHGRVVADVVRAAGSSVHGYADRDPAKCGQRADSFGASVLCSEEELFSALPGVGHAFPVALGIGDNAARLGAYARLAERAMPALLHPSAVLGVGVAIGRGTVVMAGVIISADARIGSAVILNSGAVIEHDCVIADGAHISPNATLSGAVDVGLNAWIGAGAVVLPGVRIGAGAIVGAGAVVLSDVAPGATVVGNPARPLLR